MPPDFFSPRILVLDCGASRTALGVFRRQGNRICLTEYEVEIFASAGTGDNWLEQTRRSLLALRARVQAAGPALVVLPPHLVLTKIIKVPRVSPAQREKIVRFEAGQGIPFALAEVAWDWVACGGQEGLLGAARLDAVEPLCAAVQAAGFEPQCALPSPLATLAGFRLANPGLIQPSLVLNLGARSATLLLLEPARFAVRTLPLGGNSLIRQGTESGIAGEAGDRNIPEAGAGPAEATEILATRLTQEIARTVLHFRRHSNMADPVRVYLTGGCARLAGLAEALTVKLQIPVGWFGVLDAVECGSGVPRAEIAGHALALTDLAGAAATRLDRGQPVLDLLPPSRRRRLSLRRRLPWLLAAAALAVAALLPPVVHFRHLADEAQRKTAALERALAPLREREARNRTNLRQLENLRQQAARLQGAYDRRSSWLGLLADLQDRLWRVEDVWLDKLQVVPAAAGAPVRLAFSGRLLDRSNPLSRAGPETLRRVQTLLASIGNSPFVGAIEDERFDDKQPGILRFDFVLVANPQHPL